MDSSTVPRLELRCPPVLETLSSRNARSSSASAFSCVRGSLRSSAGSWMGSSRDIWGSIVAVHDHDGECLQRRGGAQPASIERLQGLIEQFARKGARTLQAQHRNVSGFVVVGVLAGRLAERGGIGRHIEDVIY